MSTVCIVPGCPSNSHSPSHTFPKDVKRALQWLNKIKTERLDNVDPQQFHKYRVCYRHFSEKLIKTSGARRRLVDDAIPDQNLPISSQTTAALKKRIPLSPTSRLIFKKYKALRQQNGVLKRKLNDYDNKLAMVKKMISNGNFEKYDALAEFEKLFSHVKSQVTHVI